MCEEICEKMAAGCKEKLALLYFVMVAQAASYRFVLASVMLWNF